MSNRKSRLINKRLSEIKQEIEYEYTGTLDRIMDQKKQIQWIFQDFDPSESPQNSKSHDKFMFYTTTKTKQKSNHSHDHIKRKAKCSFEIFKKEKSYQRDLDTKLEIVKSKIKEKILIKSKRPFSKYKSFKRDQKKYGEHIKILSKNRPGTAASASRDRIVKVQSSAEWKEQHQKQDYFNFESIDEEAIYKMKLNKFNSSEDHMNLKFAKSRNNDNVWTKDIKITNENKERSNSQTKQKDFKFCRDLSNPNYGNRNRIQSTSDFSRMDQSESILEESVTSISRMNSITKKFFRAESVLPIRIGDSSKKTLQNKRINYENIPRALDSLRKDYINKISLFRLGTAEDNIKTEFYNTTTEDVARSGSLEPHELYGPVTRCKKRKIIEPSMIEKQGVLSQEEIQMLFFSKLIDMRMKYSGEQNERFRSSLIWDLNKEGAKTIDAIIRKNEKIKKLYLNSNQLGDEGAIAISKALSYNNSIIHLSICSNDLSSVGCNALFAAIKRSNSIISLDISSKERINRNIMDLASIKNLSDLFCVSKFLAFIDLSLMSLGDRGVEILCKGLSGNKIICSLIIQNNEFTHSCIHSINNMVTSSSLQHLDISSNPIENQGIIEFCNCINKNTCKLKIIDIADCRFTSTGCSQLLNTLRFNSSVTSINFDKNNLSGKGISMWKEFLQTNNTLQKLSLAKCNLGDIGTIFIAKGYSK